MPTPARHPTIPRLPPTPIGGSYAAIFEGNSYTISHHSPSRTTNFALFNEVSGTVRNLGLADANIGGGAAPLYDAALAVTLTGRVLGSWASGTIAKTPRTPSAGWSASWRRATAPWAVPASPLQAC